ncbi:MAG TPA: protein kinase [Kofleriaceae bacterium]|nr:protein kinase [Kofleriaceae bacterium]
MGSAPKTPKASESPAVKVGIGDLVLDRYRVVEQIASGGHSVVFRGTDERLSRPVCIKVFSGLGGKSGVGRTSYEHFVQEAFALSRLTHPNTLRIYDFGHLGAKDAEGMPVQVCEFMNGGTLSQVVREHGRQTLAETSRVIGAMCAALGEAHALGIVHRDIKPQNILFGSVGASKLPKLADFGIAKWSVDDSETESKRAEDTAIVAGQKLAMYSPSWAAPEQLAGQTVSAVTDIYSLAVVAIYMLSGKAIFAEEDVYAGYKKRRHADDLVRDTLAPLGVPKSVIHLLGRALAFDPKKRLARVEELATELAAALEPATDEQVRVPDVVTPTVPTPSITPPKGMPSTARPTAVTRSAAPPATTKQAFPAPVPAAGSAPIATPHVPAPIDETREVASAPHAAPAHAAHWTPPVQVQTPWMASAPVPRGAPHWLPLSDVPQVVSDRQVHFIQATNGVADLVGGQGKVRITFLTGPTGARVIHVKGMSCFVAHLGGRPSPAVHLEQPSDIALVTPRAQEIGHMRVANGTLDGHHLIFPIGHDRAGIAVEDCTDPILFDFGPGSDAYFVYTRGRPIPKSRRR